MARFAASISYHGGQYHGWQKQQDEIKTVEACLGTAIAKVANHPVSLICAGRTDAGVHALGQVIHFDTTACRSIENWQRGTNRYLPDDIRVNWVKKVDLSFHARFSASMRQYVYVINQYPMQSPINSGQHAWIPGQLQVDLMKQASKHWLGEHDFSTFRGRHCQSKSPCRLMHSIHYEQNEHWVLIYFNANAFLQHMIRMMMDVLIKVGQRQQKPEWALALLKGRRRSPLIQCGPAQGLYLINACYPEVYQLPIIRQSTGIMNGILL